MNSITSFIQRTGAGLSARVRAASAVGIASPVPVFAVANSAFGGGNPVGTAMSSNHMDSVRNTGWLGGFAETGCVKTTYVAKRITTGSLREALT
jgi:hypothetical protein